MAGPHLSMELLRSWVVGLVMRLIPAPPEGAVPQLCLLSLGNTMGLLLLFLHGSFFLNVSD